MATVTSIQGTMRIKELATEMVCALGKARAMASVLTHLGEEHNNLVHALAHEHPEDTRGWLHQVVAEALAAAHDDIASIAIKIGAEKASQLGALES
jgi:hypothetical protein